MSGNPKLAALMQTLDIKPPMEKIALENWLVTCANIDKIKHGERYVHLACGHHAWTKAKKKVACMICHQMILDGKDYELFRRDPMTYLSMYGNDDISFDKISTPW
jgi:hypothetical protein